MQKQLASLKKQIDILEQQVNISERQNYHEHYFDEHLFNTTKITADNTFYLEKIKQTYQSLVNNVMSQKDEQITYLSEMIVNQITALTRELATYQLRKEEKSKLSFQETLYEKHSRHLDYLRRLQEMKYEFELSAESIDPVKIATLDNRIYRCERAIKAIELEMEDDTL